MAGVWHARRCECVGCLHRLGASPGADDRATGSGVMPLQRALAYGCGLERPAPIRHFGDPTFRHGSSDCWAQHTGDRIALPAAGFDVREVPASRSVAQRRWRRLDKTAAVSTACCTSPQSPRPPNSPTRPPTSPARPPKARLDAEPDEPTNATSPTESSAECGATKPPVNNPNQPPLDKGASDSPGYRDLTPLDTTGAAEGLSVSGTTP